MYPIIRLGGLSVQSYGLVLLAAFWLGLYVAGREAERLELGSDVPWNFGTYSLIAGLVGARLWYVLTNLEAYWLDWRQVLALNTGTLAFREGAIIGLLVGLGYLRRQEVSLPAFADALAPGLAAALALASFGAFLNGDAYGAPTSLPLAVYLWGERRHPTQLYEMGAALIILAILWRWRAREPYPGFLFLLGLLLYAAARLSLEAFRGDSLLMVGGLRVVQVVSLATVMGVLVIMYRQKFRGEA